MELDTTPSSASSGPFMWLLHILPSAAIAAAFARRPQDYERVVSCPPPQPTESSPVQLLLWHEPSLTSSITQLTADVTPLHVLHSGGYFY